MSFVRNLLSKFQGVFAAVIFLLICGGGLFLAGALLITAAENGYVTINVFLVFGILLNLWVYRKNRKPLLRIESWKRESKIVGILGFVVSALASINYWQGVISAPLMFFFLGAYCLYLYYSISQDGKKNLEKYENDQTYKYEPILKRTPQWVIGSLIALLLTSGYWYIQIQKNEQIQKEEATEAALSLTEYQDYREYPSNAVVRINSVVDIEFSKIKAEDQPGKVLNVCLDALLSFSRDGRYFQEIFTPIEICFNEENTFGWSEFAVQEVADEILQEELDYRLS